MSQTVRNIFVLCCTALLLPLSAFPQEPDNTRENRNNRPTADQAKETKADRELAAKIRKSVVDDKALSANAHNVKIIVENGVVTLKGPVESVQEREAIQAKARQLTISSDIHNELTVISK
jgi:hyperosmotically inducible protein